MVVVFLLVKLTSSGPSIYRSERVGYGGSKFSLYKFRTMYEDSEKIMEVLLGMSEVTGPVFKLRNDPRITSVGRFLRRTSLDDIPQFLNVLRGEMALVGPRPLTSQELHSCFKDGQSRIAYLALKPGVTGLNPIRAERWEPLKYEEYLTAHSPALDLKIFVTWFFGVFKGSATVE
jgi:lipopolysaccharide/colanic/teichoic acid biosynthesis glycosyltransferase